MNKNPLTNMKSWVHAFVIGRSLCPFAKVPYDKELIHFCKSDEVDEEKILMDIWDEVEALCSMSPQARSNTILVLEDSIDFDNYLGIIEDLVALLENYKLDSTIQVASFHPDYTFKGTNDDDASNYTNRSPYPMVHILRIEEVARAIDSHPDVSSIPRDNIEKMNKLGLEYLKSNLNLYRN